MDKTQDIVNMLKMYNQEHIINLLNKLDEQKKWELIDQISILYAPIFNKVILSYIFIFSKFLK